MGILLRENDSFDHMATSKSGTDQSLVKFVQLLKESQALVRGESVLGTWRSLVQAGDPTPDPRPHPPAPRGSRGPLPLPFFTARPLCKLQSSGASVEAQVPPRAPGFLGQVI